MSNLRIKQLRSCPYISFKFLNIMSVVVGIATFIIAILLFLELHVSEGLYTFGYMTIAVICIAISLYTLSQTNSLVMMSRSRRKLLLSLLWMTQFVLFGCHIFITASLWVNFGVVQHLVATNTREILTSLDSLKMIAIYMGLGSLILGLNVLMTLYFRKYLGKEQIRIEY
jgi:hypothetical protein